MSGAQKGTNSMVLIWVQMEVNWGLKRESLTGISGTSSFCPAEPFGRWIELCSWERRRVAIDKVLVVLCAKHTFVSLKHLKIGHLHTLYGKSMAS